MISIEKGKCTGCRRCEIICSMAHHQRVDPYRRRIRISSEWPWKDEVIVCRMCQKPKCVESCAAGALTKSEEGHIILDADACTGCFACVEACPFDAVWADEQNGLPILCDTCGGAYACVKWCPENVLGVK